MPRLPTGTVTFLFTDIEGSTLLLERLREQYAGVLAQHHRLLRGTFEKHGGHEIDTQGDAFFVAFARAKDAAQAALEAQRAITAHSWPQGVELRVRMGLHTGEPLVTTTGYVGMDVHRAARVCAAGYGGQILLSESTRVLIGNDLLEGVSLRNLGEHRLKDLARPEHLFQLVATDLPAEFPLLRSLNVLPNNLPIQLTSFVGREREINELMQALFSTRLLTLTGAGGVGKTRLALQVSAEVLEEFSDGVWLVELAALPDPELVPQTVAAVLGIREQSGRPVLTTLADSLGPRRLLLVLDNCEHLIAACAQFAHSLLRTCAHLRILATSREALGVAGETAWLVPSLSIPDSRRTSAVSISQFEAVRLFVERAAAALPSFRFTSQNSDAVIQICTRLDGIPLAIEMAAARLKALSVEQIATRLDDQFRLLTAGGRTVLPQHQTLRATLDWSYDLLSGEERQLLRQLGVFAGGFALEAVEKVCGEDARAPEVVNLLTRLVEKSLVIAERRDDRVRYRLLEPIRQYAREKFSASGESDALQGRHLEFFLAMAEEPHYAPHGPTFDQWLERIEEEHDNVRTALDWALDGAAPNAGLQLATAMWRFWVHRGYLSEGRSILERALSVAGNASPSLRARALSGAGYMALTQDDYARATALCEEAHTIARAEGDQQGMAIALAILGHTLWHMGDATRPAQLCDESLKLAKRSQDQRTLASSLREFGYVAWHIGDYERLAQLADEYLHLSRLLGDRSATADALLLLGEAALGAKQYSRAGALYEESLTSSRVQKDKVAMTRALVSLGNVAAHDQNYDRAGALYREALTTAAELRDMWWLVRCLQGMAGAAAAQGQFPRAAQLLGAVNQFRETMGSPLPRTDQNGYDRTIAVAGSKLGDQAFRAAWAEGRAMSLEQAVALALADS
ncbi:MAG: adenylate/guanylate cyclase domain-containing protein [Armatimonadetes bacterium]|nr:adenylate/guanylate cyclase domain-containing protein [Armatimonadota bacterium]